MGLQRLGIYDIKIQSLVPEGTLVKAGDIVATLDQSALEQGFQQATTDVQAAESRFIQNRLDTTLTLRGVRDELRNRSEEHTSELQSLMRTSYAVFCFTKKTI